MPQAGKNQGQDDDLDLNTDLNDDVQIDIEDDTPPEDRGRKPLEKEPEVADDEAAQYTKGVQKRIGELTHKMHDERRRREAAEREREQAIKFAQSAHQRVRLMEQQLNNGEAAFADTTTAKEELAIETARDKYRKAYESGDPDAIANATAEIAAASQRLENAKLWAAQAKNKVNQKPLQQENDVVNFDRDVNTQRQTAPLVEEPDEASQEWAKKNEWFGKDRKMTSYVYGIHEELVFDQGLHPVENAKEYYAAIDREMRKRFPEHEWGDEAGTEVSTDDKPQPAKKTTSVVAPVSRTPTGNGKKVVLKKSELAIAERFGLTPEQYAREKLKLGDA